MSEELREKAETWLHVIEVRGCTKLLKKNGFNDAQQEMDRATLNETFIKPGTESNETAHLLQSKLEVGQ